MLKISNQCHYFKQPARELVEKVQSVSIKDDITLQIDDNQVRLCASIHQQRTCFAHALTDPNLLRRARQKNQALLRACNNRKKEIHSIIDLTAGWGKDSLMLAAHGQQVVMVEHHPLVYACMKFLLEIARHLGDDEIYHRLSIRQQNSLQALQEMGDSHPGCLYLDPMFPAHKSTARPGKDLQILQLLTQNQNMEEVFTLALECASHRVVVKRPLHAPTLNDFKPDIVYREKTIRFDVYLT